MVDFWSTYVSWHCVLSRLHCSSLMIKATECACRSTSPPSILSNYPWTLTRIALATRSDLTTQRVQQNKFSRGTEVLDNRGKGATAAGHVVHSCLLASLLV